MKIYKFRGDLRSAQTISYDDSKGGQSYPWFDDGTPKGNWESPEGLYIEDLRKPAANFYKFGLDLVFDETVYKLTRDLLEKAGEVFPLEVEGASQLYIFNPTLGYEALDKEKYEPQGETFDGEPYGIGTYAFLTEALGDSSLFKLSDLEAGPMLGPLLAISGGQSEDDEFIGRYLKNKLTGLKMIELWSD